jgi:hypothetical protein
MMLDVIEVYSYYNVSEKTKHFSYPDSFTYRVASIKAACGQTGPNIRGLTTVVQIK